MRGGQRERERIHTHIPPLWNSAWVKTTRGLFKQFPFLLSPNLINPQMTLELFLHPLGLALMRTSGSLMLMGDEMEKNREPNTFIKPLSLILEEALRKQAP